MSYFCLLLSGILYHHQIKMLSHRNFQKSHLINDLERVFSSSKKDSHVCLLKFSKQIPKRPLHFLLQNLGDENAAILF